MGIEDKIDEPGTCSNRLSEVYFDKTWKKYWEYDIIKNDIGHFNEYLAYPQPTDYWKLSTKNNKMCGPICYHGHFEWMDLLNCRNYNDEKCKGINVKITQKWINLTGTFYIDIISSNDDDNNGKYFVYNLDSIDFVIPISKSIVGHKSSLNQHLNLFTITIAAVYKYKERSDIGYKLILLTESSDYIILENPLLLSYPMESISNIEYISQAINGENCINNDAYLCSQLWEIYIDNISCPPIDLSGFYSLQFNAKCNPLIDKQEANQNAIDICNEYEYDDIKKVSLSSHLSWIDSICEPKYGLYNFMVH